MATNHGSHDGGTDATKGTGAIHSASGSKPSSRVASTTETPQDRHGTGQDHGGQVHPGIAAIKNALGSLTSTRAVSTDTTAPRLDLAALSDEETLASIGQLETIGRIIESVQAVLTSHLIDSRTAEQRAKDRSPRNVRAGVIRDVSLHRGLNATRARKVVDVAIDAPEPVKFSV
ncbi:hypothetical protein [Galactobacter sp.]|uniref:hypothetical protein n=1 Tax=Galactobacter sp. TaxID=2676125 RepID=UPI0025C23462|nr:hypothetical protein [Galactobacter sp.]